LPKVTLLLEHIPLAATDYFVARCRREYTTNVETVCGIVRIIFIFLRLIWYDTIKHSQPGGVMVRARWTRDSKGRGFEPLPLRFLVATSGKLFVHACLCHQSIILYCQEVVMAYDRKGNRRSGV